jgi:hypothetical protein
MNLFLLEYECFSNLKKNGPHLYGAGRFKLGWLKGLEPSTTGITIQ